MYVVGVLVSGGDACGFRSGNVCRMTGASASSINVSEKNIFILFY